MKNVTLQYFILGVVWCAKLKPPLMLLGKQIYYFVLRRVFLELQSLYAGSFVNVELSYSMCAPFTFAAGGLNCAANLQEDVKFWEQFPQAFCSSIGSFLSWLWAVSEIVFQQFNSIDIAGDHIADIKWKFNKLGFILNYTTASQDASTTVTLHLFFVVIDLLSF